MNLAKFFSVYFMLILISGCTSTRMYTYSADGKETICGDYKNTLGHTVVLLEAAWRKDQKEPALREQMVLEEVNRAFDDFPCGNISLPGDIREFSNWTALPAQEMLNTFSKEAVDTVIIIRVEELTPRLNISFSIPFLWSGTNEADFRVKTISVKTGNILTDMRIKRETGGPFNIRPAEWSREELYMALRSVIKKTAY